MTEGGSAMSATTQVWGDVLLMLCGIGLGIGLGTALTWWICREAESLTRRQEQAQIELWRNIATGLQREWDAAHPRSEAPPETPRKPRARRTLYRTITYGKN